MRPNKSSQIISRLKVVGVSFIWGLVIIAVATTPSCPGSRPVTNRKVEFTGRVINAVNERPIRRAKVVLEAHGVPPIIYTDSEGIFSFTLEDVNDVIRIRVRVEAEGYQKFDRNVSLSSAGKPIEDIRLEPAGGAAPTGKSSPPTVNTPPTGTGTSPPDRDRASDQPITYQEVDGIGVTLLGGRIIGDTVRFEFEVTNHNPRDKRIDLFGRGSFGNGHSRMITDGQEYSADTMYFGDGSGGIVGRRLPPDTPLKASLTFKGVPGDLRLIKVLELAYSDNNLRPEGVLRFTKIPLE
jgi:hypothetical protein